MREISGLAGSSSFILAATFFLAWSNLNAAWAEFDRSCIAISRIGDWSVTSHTEGIEFRSSGGTLAYSANTILPFKSDADLQRAEFMPWVTFDYSVDNKEVQNLKLGFSAPSSLETTQLQGAIATKSVKPEFKAIAHIARKSDLSPYDAGELYAISLPLNSLVAKGIRNPLDGAKNLFLVATGTEALFTLTVAAPVFDQIEAHHAVVSNIVTACKIVRMGVASGERQKNLLSMLTEKEYASPELKEPVWLLRRSALLFASDQRGRAIADADAIVKTLPQQAWARCFRGLLHEGSGDFMKASAEFTSGKSLDPNDAICAAGWNRIDNYAKKNKLGTYKD